MPATKNTFRYYEDRINKSIITDDELTKAREIAEQEEKEAKRILKEKRRQKRLIDEAEHNLRLQHIGKIVVDSFKDGYNWDGDDKVLYRNAKKLIDRYSSFDDEVNAAVAEKTQNTEELKNAVCNFLEVLRTTTRRNGTETYLQAIAPIAGNDNILELARLANYEVTGDVDVSRNLEEHQHHHKETPATETITVLENNSNLDI